ncbi:unnamed protein product [Blepharisma stoltei]|uniref:Transposase n=1 Tax=Blepharisma stoltei TaxID=1481888 RepID=A0AAU9KIG5_9CILI|nr:unnamed protein product [Blepharisma stoltei]
MQPNICDICHNPCLSYRNGGSMFLRCTLCNLSFSIRRRSIFSQSRLSISKMVRLIFHCFVREQSMITIVEDSEISKDAAIKLFKKLRALISEHEIENYFTDNQLGIEDENGQDHPTVELDETHIMTMDHDPKWLFGIFDRGEQKTIDLLCRQR